MSAPKDESIVKQNVSRRRMLKWSGALAAAGVVGVGLGFGGDILLRPSVTSTSTTTATVNKSTTVTASGTTATTTVTAPPTTLSYVPPLSPQVAARANEVISELSSMHEGETIKYTCCTGTQCFRFCILRVRTKNGVITGFDTDNSVNQGIGMEDQYMNWNDVLNLKTQSRTCPMSFGFLNILNDPNRLIYPMQNTGTRGNPTWVRIPMDTAISTVAQMLQDTKNTYGPYSMWFAPYGGDLPFEAWWGAGTSGWDAYSAEGVTEPAWWVQGTTSGVGDMNNLSHSKMIILWGFNPVQTQQGEAGWYFRMFREKGTPIIVLDHRYTWTAESCATQWIPIRPGTDAAFAIAVANVLFSQNLVNESFVNQWVEPTGFAAWKAYVLGQTAGPDGAINRTPDWAAPICGVPADTITAFAQFYAANSPVAIIFGAATGRQIFGENIARAVMYLQAMTGNVGIVGGTSGSYNLQAPKGTGYWGDLVPTVNWQRPAATYVPPVFFEAWRWAHAINQYKLLQSGTITEAQYCAEVGLPIGYSKANIQMIIVENSQLSTTPNTPEVIQAFKNVKYVVSVTSDLVRPAARYADIVIPQCYAQFESRQPRTGNTVSETGGSNLLFRDNGNYWFYMQKCVDPPGDVVAEDFFWLQVARQLGVAAQYQPLLTNVTSTQDYDETMESIMETTYNTWAATPAIAALNPPSWTNFQTMPVWRWPKLNTPNYDYMTALNNVTPPTSPFTTASGKVEFVSPILSNGPSWLAANGVHPSGSGECYGPGNLAVMAEWQSGAGDAFYSPDTTSYPILISTPHSNFRQHSWLDNNLMLQDTYRHAIWLSVPDAQARGIVDGDLVHVYNNQGEMILPAYVTSRVVPGSGVNFESAWYIADPTRKTQLMPDGIDVRGNCNVIDRVISTPYTINGYLNCHGLAQVEKYTGTSQLQLVAGSTTTSSTTSTTSTTA